MHAVVVGADKPGAIPDMLVNMGITIQKHISGRSAVHKTKLPALPAGTELLILFTDFLGHNVMCHFRELARLEKWIAKKPLSETAAAFARPSQSA